MENGFQMTLDQWMPEASPNRIVGASDSPVKTSASADNKSDLLETAQVCFSELCTWLDNSRKRRNPLTCSSKMLEICLVLMADGTSPGFSLSWTRGGYDAEWQILNAKDYTPQNRERVFIIGHLRGRAGSEVFPIGENENKNKILQIAEYDVDRKNSNSYRVYSPNGLAPTLTTVGGGGRMPFVKLENGIRRLTPKEFFRLQGWSDQYFAKASLVNADGQLYKQAGNGVTVNVIKAIAQKM